MNSFAQLLEPSAEWLPGLQAGIYRINAPANRVVDAKTGEFVSALVPSDSLAYKLASLPLQPEAATEMISHTAELSQLTPVLNALQLTSSIGVLASVANLGVSCVGFAVVMHRLSRIEGKLDDLLGKVEVLQQAVHALHARMDALSVARVRSAGEALERALAAESAATRRELSVHARNLFQESRHLFLELWRCSRPLEQAAVPVLTALEMQGRYVACAIGELQSEFIAGDLGAFRHAAASIARDLTETMGFDPVAVFRIRSDQTCSGDLSEVTLFQAGMQELARDLRTTQAVTEWSSHRLAGYGGDADLVTALGVEPHELARGMRGIQGDDFYFLKIPRAGASEQNRPAAQA